MRIIFIIIASFLFQSAIFSQTDNTITIQECIDLAVLNHPLQKQSDLLQSQLTTQHELQDKSKMPELSWNAQARIQSESIGLDFENPMIPAIEIPIYSAQTTIDVNYTLYDGGITPTMKQLQTAKSNLSLEQNNIAIDQVKQEVISYYLNNLFLQQKEKVLLNSMDLIIENINRLSAAKDFGVVSKSAIQQLIIKKMELESQINANKTDILISKKLLSEAIGKTIGENVILIPPEPKQLDINNEVDQCKLHIYDLQQQLVEAQKQMIPLENKPKVFAFISGGFGYPNPLNFFDDSFSPFAIGGLGFKWNFYDWGANKKELQLIQIQKEMIKTQKMNSTSIMNRKNSHFQLGIEKNMELIEAEKAIIKLKKELANTQQERLTEGVILPIEYLNNLNTIIDSELKLNRYNLEISKLKLEYQLLKGQL